MMTKDQREAVRVRLGELELSNGGRLTPSMVVQDAKDPASPLHDYFQWDERKAAEAYWLEQARDLITSVRVVMTTDQRSVDVVYYVRDPSAQTDEQGYVSVPTLRSESEMAREALVSEFTHVADRLRRARQLAEVLGAADDVDALLTDVVGLRRTFMEQPAQTM
jgi:hypothetical protein